MIPRLLEIKNFLSYGQSQQVIDFTRYSLICLSGKNGHGKSALLDAITWALWGQARKITTAVKADEGLIRLGQTQMMVSLEFEMNQRRYRVRREYAKTYGKPYAMLDFELFDLGQQRFVSLTDKTIRATQDKIEQTINLDFETFINSAFLRQGHANEFSNKSPKERKQILTTILGFATYDRLYKACQEKVKTFLDEQKILKQADEHQQVERQREPDIQNQFEHHNQLLKTAHQHIDHVEQQLARCHQEQAHFEQLKRNYIQTDHSQQEILTTIKHQKEKLLTLRAAWKTTHHELLSSVDRTELEKKRLTLMTQERMLLEQQQQEISIKNRLLEARHHYQIHEQQLKASHEQAITSARIALDKEQSLSEHVKQNAKEKIKTRAHVEQELHSLSEQITELVLQQANQAAWYEYYEQQQKAFEKRKQAYQRFVQKRIYLLNQQEKLEQQKTMLEETPSPACPLCSSHLTHPQQQDLCNQFNQTLQHHTYQLTRLDLLIGNLKILLVAQRSALTHDQTRHKKFVQDETRSQELERQRNLLTQQLTLIEQELKELTQTYHDVQQKIAAHTASLQHLQSQSTTLAVANPQAQHLRKSIDLMSAELAQASALLAPYQHIRQELSNLELQLQKSEHLHQEQIRQQERKLAIKQLCKELKELHKRHTEEVRKRDVYTYSDQHEHTLALQKKNLEQDRTQLHVHKEALAKQIGRLEETLQQIEKLNVAALQRAQTLKKLDYELGHYQALAEAFSKNGIQALLIEEAIPEIEDEANKLLAKLTSNQSQVFIESLRDLKSGGVKETLDIKIADAQGIRPYELFSGGESFRIDFALRIAISKLLARRAGTSLQTLIIDEGFGSQDEEGLSRLMQAIHAVQHDFEKVIIVSHMNEFKDNFPVHFVVEKTTIGSTIRIEERG